MNNEEYEKMALSDQNVIKHLENLTIRRVLVVPNKLVNIVAN